MTTYRGFLDTTEILRDGEKAWRDVGRLPETTFGLSGVNLNNVIYMTGGDYYRYSPVDNSTPLQVRDSRVDDNSIDL